MALGAFPFFDDAGTVIQAVGIAMHAKAVMATSAIWSVMKPDRIREVIYFAVGRPFPSVALIGFLYVFYLSHRSPPLIGLSLT